MGSQSLPTRIVTSTQAGSASTFGIMKNHFFAVALFSVTAPPVIAQPELERSHLERSHIEANVPQAEEFQRLLQRDLLAFFNKMPGSAVSAVEAAPLRNEPTQTGLSYSKLYFWVTVMAGSSVRHVGAVRVAAIQRVRFEVTDFLPVASIQARPREVDDVFPAALVPAIQERAAGK